MNKVVQPPDKPKTGKVIKTKKKKPSIKLRSGKNIVPSESIASTALVFVIAIMAFLACLTLGAVAMINSSANQWQSDISREVTIQIKPADGREMEKSIRAASRIALSFPGVSKVTALNDAATARLLEPWLGAGLELSELPVPRLLTVSIAEENQPDFEAMRIKLEEEVPGASLDDHRAWVERLTTMAVTMVIIGLSVFGLMMAATVTTVIFATRGAMSGNKDVVEVLHFVGADSTFISRQFQHHFLLLGLKGAIVGTLAAVGLFVLLGLWSSYSVATPQGDQITALFGSFSPGLFGYAGMIAVLLLVAGLTAFTSRWTVYKQIQILQDYNRIT